MKKWICFVLSGLIYFEKFSEILFFIPKPQSSLEFVLQVDIRLLINCSVLINDNLRRIEYSGYNYYFIR